MGRELGHHGEGTMFVTGYIDIDEPSSQQGNLYKTCSINTFSIGDLCCIVQHSHPLSKDAHLF